MAFKLKKTGVETLLKHAQAVRLAHSELEDAAEKYNAAMRAALDFVREVAEEFREQFDEKSESWQEGERGEAANEFVESWEAILQDHDEFQMPDIGLPDALESLDHEMGS